MKLENIESYENLKENLGKKVIIFRTWGNQTMHERGFASIVYPNQYFIGELFTQPSNRKFCGYRLTNANLFDKDYNLLRSWGDADIYVGSFDVQKPRLVLEDSVEAN
ncbi:hypothetical protein K8R47_03515 [archaeon]|nr:hypothetical protein [archaeon]